MFACIKQRQTLPPDDRKSVGKRAKSQRCIYTRCYRRIMPEPSPFEQMSQEELNAQAKTLLSAAGYGPQKPLK
ncbi:hypothetical protein ACNKHL_10920 [Shigella flexneri]